MKYIRHFFIAVLLLVRTAAQADEGMWLPLLLSKLNEKQMKSLGMKISAKDIYSINSGSLKDAIVSFGGFCTGEVISSKGLVLTNHHCGFDAVQNHSSLDYNYIRDGFWAKNYNEELKNPGLFATFIIRIEDVSSLALSGVNATMSESERQSTIDKNIALIRKNAKKESYQDSFVRGFFEGNQYYLFITETYKDIRLVGAPPAAIGNFGKDTDNWMWPRHTGDFSMFRIYSAPDGKPAAFAKENIPLKPKHALPVSIKGYKPNDYAMIMGYPGTTDRFLTSYGVKLALEETNPSIVKIRDKKLELIKTDMDASDEIRIKYSSKYQGTSNYWKFFIGQSKTEY